MVRREGQNSFASLSWRPGTSSLWNSAPGKRSGLLIGGLPASTRSGGSACVVRNITGRQIGMGRPDRVSGVCLLVSLRAGRWQGRCAGFAGREDDSGLRKLLGLHQRPVRRLVLVLADPVPGQRCAGIQDALHVGVGVIGPPDPLWAAPAPAAHHLPIRGVVASAEVWEWVGSHPGWTGRPSRMRHSNNPARDGPHSRYVPIRRGNQVVVRCRGEMCVRSASRN